MLAVILAYLDDENDAKRLEDIFCAYSKQMIVVARSFVGNQTDAEDIVSAVFTKIASRNFDKVRSIRREEDLRNYLLKATKNTALSVLRKRTRERKYVEDRRDFSLYEGSLCSNEDLVERILTKLDSEEAMRALEAMPDRYRQALYYHLVLGYTVAETAELLFQTRAATKKQVQRGRKMLIKLLEEKGVRCHVNVTVGVGGDLSGSDE